MPDLMTIDTAWCKSNVYWEKRVPGSNGAIHLVVYGPSNGPYQYGWRCSCPAFRYGKGKPCKHIKAVEHERCTWGEEAAMGSFPDIPGDRKCPKCGGPLVGVRVAV